MLLDSECRSAMPIYNEDIGGNAAGIGSRDPKRCLPWWWVNATMRGAKLWQTSRPTCSRHFRSATRACPFAGFIACALRPLNGMGQQLATRRPDNLTRSLRMARW
jgi:hypothetical protein